MASAGVWEWAQVRVVVAGVGLSVVGPDRELMYASVAGIRLRATASSGRFTFEAALQVRSPPCNPCDRRSIP